MPRILIVEDDTDINNSTAEYLRRQGCECVQAFSGTEGRLLWQEGGVDLLLVDLMLPGLSGSKLIAEIRKTSRDAGHRAVRQNRALRQGGAAGPGGGRLSDQALPAGGAVGSDTGAAAPRQTPPPPRPFCITGTGC